MPARAPRELIDVSCRVALDVRAEVAQPLVTVHPMRIELPAATWADAAHRADDDAHTLTVAPLPSAPHWPGDAWAGDPAAGLRTEVSAQPPVTLTLTLTL